jgi:hypothetical protein
MEHLKMLNENDLVIYDRGYFSYLQLYCYVEIKIHVVFRIQKSVYKEIDDFTSSSAVEKVIVINPSKDVQSRVKKLRPDIQFKPLNLRLIKYTIENETYTLGTTLMDSDLYPASEFCDLYHSRWGIEGLYDISKNLIEVGDFHGHSDRGVKQELYAHFVLITFTRIFSNKAEKELENSHFDKTGSAEKSPKVRVNFKNSLASISRNLEGLFSQYTNLVNQTVREILKSSVRCRHKERPGRQYPRRSRRPLTKWWISKQKEVIV